MIGPAGGATRPFTVTSGIYRVVQRFSENRCTFMAAATSFYAFFAIFPFALLALVILSYIIDPLMVKEQIVTIAGFYLLHTSNLVEENLERMLRVRGQVGAFSVIALYWASSGVFFSLRVSLNRIWQVAPRRSFWHSKSLDLALTSAFLMVLALTAAGSTAVRAAVAVMSEEMPVWLKGGTGLLVGVALTTLLFALAYRIIPNTSPPAAAVIIGGLVGAVGFELIRWAFTWYLLTLSPYQLVYGSLGTVIAFLFWIYLSISVFLFGATVAETAQHWFLGWHPRSGAASPPEEMPQA